jgi:CRISPR-associated exonuclease Cas4
LIGQADIVEFNKSPYKGSGVLLNGISGHWCPLIVEYKRGKPKIGHEDEVQLCAQVMCLEEMLETEIESSSFFYGRPRRRFDLVLPMTKEKNPSP